MFSISSLSSPLLVLFLSAISLHLPSVLLSVCSLIGYVLPCSQILGSNLPIHTPGILPLGRCGVLLPQEPICHISLKSGIDNDPVSGYVLFSFSIFSNCNPFCYPQQNGHRKPGALSHGRYEEYEVFLFSCRAAPASPRGERRYLCTFTQIPQYFYTTP